MRWRIFTGAGLAVFLLSPFVLLGLGGSAVRTSADAEASPKPLIAIVVATLAGLLLTRLVPPQLPAIAPADAAHRPALTRQAVGLVGIALLLPAIVLTAEPGVWYGLVKLVLFFGGAWLLLRRWPTDWRGGSTHRASMPARWRRLGPVPALLGWAYLLYYSPFAGTEDLSGYREFDRAFLLSAMLLTFLTASLAEEIFYRMLLQTRLEALLGRWPAIMATALLFAAMHVHRIGDGPLAEMIAIMVVWNGGFGLLTGYLWARYRNIWSIVVLHTAVNSLPLLPLFLE